MTQNGYLQPRRANPVGIGIVVALHVAAVGAAMLMPPEMVDRIKEFTPLRIEDIPADPPPAPPPPPETPRAAAPPVFAPVPVVRTDPAPAAIDVTPVIVPPPPVLPPPPALDPAPPPRAAPVLTIARMDPRYADALQPDYPPAMARLEREGTATVRVLIGPDGRVRRAEAVSATDRAFADATVAHALRRWRFVPSTEDGRAVESWFTITVRFVLS